MLWLKLAEEEARITDFETMAKYAKRAPTAREHISGVDVGFLQLNNQVIEKMTFGVVGVNLREFFPLLRLGGLQKLQHILHVERSFAIVAVAFADNPAVGGHLVDDVVLQVDFAGDVGGHWAASASSVVCSLGARQ